MSVLAQTPQWVQDLGGVAGVMATLVGLVVVAVRWLRRELRLVIIEETTPLREQIDIVKHEVLANSGTSLRDAVDRLERRLTAVATQVAVLDALVQQQAHKEAPHD